MAEVIACVLWLGALFLDCIVNALPGNRAVERGDDQSVEIS